MWAALNTTTVLSVLARVLAQQRNRLRRLGGQVLRRRLDADPPAVSNPAQSGEERLVLELVPRERKHPAVWVRDVDVPDVVPRTHDDIRILVLAGQMKEVHHQLECRNADHL